MKNNLGIYGGFAGTETQLAQRNWNSNLCILSGDIGTVADTSDNSYHVIANYALNSTAVLNGFTITAGNANSQSTFSTGGGMINNTASPTISYCTFTGNSAKSGAAIFNQQSSPAISSCSFTSNPGIDGNGFAMVNIGASTPVISYCYFTGNPGGGMYNNVSSPTITNCSFIGNEAKFYGGGIQNIANSVITNCIFIGNKAGTSGGGIYNTGQTSVINGSFSGNEAATGGGVFNSNSQTITITNSIVHGNSSEIINEAGSSANVTNSIVKGGYPGTGNLDADPQFLQQPPVGPGTNGNLRLQPCSPAINMGNDAANSIVIDLDNNFRKFGIIDMGAYERQSAKPIVWYLDKNATGNGDGTSWANAFTDLTTALVKLKDCNTTDSLKIAAGIYYSSGLPSEFDKLNGVVLAGYPTGGGDRDPQANEVFIWGGVNVRQSMRIEGLKLLGF
jgi:predicted outer membrane repeat protein